MLSTFLPFFEVQVPSRGKMLFYGIAGLLAMVRLNDTNGLFVYNVFYLDSLQGFKRTVINPHRVLLYVWTAFLFRQEVNRQGNANIDVHYHASRIPVFWPFSDITSFSGFFFFLFAFSCPQRISSHASTFNLFNCVPFWVLILPTWIMQFCCSAHTAAKSHQSCLTLCHPIDSSPPGSRPWDSPGKNTGVGCHFLLQCMKVKSESEVAQSCPTLRLPMDCSLPGSSIHGIC